MANLQNFRHYRHVNLLENVGQKVKNAAELAGTMKGIYDLGRGVYAEKLRVVATHKLLLSK